VPCSPTPGQLFWGYDYALPPQAGRLHTCGAFSDGARCWGDNASGQVGDGTTTDAPNPVTITRRAADAGSTMTCSADLWCWGTAPVFGQHTTPSRVGDPVVFTKVAVGGSFACGLTSAGAAYCFGDNRAGQLGRGTFSAGEAIGPVSGGLAFTQLSAGETFVCGLSGGAVYCWGAVAVSPAAGDVGCAGGRCVATPQPEAPGFTFGWLSAGGGAYTTAGTMRGHVCGSTTAGIYCWGRNDQGQLGNGTRNSTNTPQQVRYVRDS
jgi:alpha-tubulin suppressor-like RCC1 family protein